MQELTVTNQPEPLRIIGTCPLGQDRLVVVWFEPRNSTKPRVMGTVSTRSFKGFLSTSRGTLKLIPPKPEEADKIKDRLKNSKITKYLVDGFLPDQQIHFPFNTAHLEDPWEKRNGITTLKTYLPAVFSPEIAENITGTWKGYIVQEGTTRGFIPVQTPPDNNGKRKLLFHLYVAAKKAGLDQEPVSWEEALLKLKELGRKIKLKF